MWDVKYILSAIIRGAIIGFTLTMWDVKSILDRIVGGIKD